MARCAHCNSFIIGGKSDGTHSYCNDRCLITAHILRVADQVPPDVLAEQVITVHQGNCPKCGKAGPVDVHQSHFIWSIILMSSWSSKPEVCCNRCGVKKKVASALGCLVVGWWGFPWGLIGTPVQIIRNLAELPKGARADAPSEKLTEFVQVALAQQLMAQAEQEERARAHGDTQPVA